MKTNRLIRWATYRIGLPLLVALIAYWLPDGGQGVIALMLGGYIISLLILVTAEHSSSGDLSLGYDIAKWFLARLTPFAWSVILFIVFYALITLRFDTVPLMRGWASYAFSFIPGLSA
jgi:hypothetical protein